MSRHYVVDGERFPSVTTALEILNKPALARWRGTHGNGRADEIRDDAAGLGTLIHKAVEAINAGGGTEWWAGVSPVGEIIQAYLTWFRQAVAEVIGVEQMVTSRRYRYAGTADLVAMLWDDTAPAVVDIKTSNYVDEYWPLQLAGYRMALREQGIDCERRLVVRLPKNKPGELITHEYHDHDGDERAFRNVLNIWRWRDAQRPKVPRIRVGGKGRP